MVKSYLLLLLLVIGNGQLIFAEGGKINSDDRCVQLINDWTNKALYLTKNTPGYSAPVSARTFSYFFIANYEAMLPVLKANRSLDGQIAGYSRPDFDFETNELAFEHIANYLNYKLANYFYQNMSPRDSIMIQQFYKDNYAHYKKDFRKKRIKNSERYTDLLLNEIISWCEKDGAAKAWNSNFPSSYIPPKCDSCWERTLPGYVEALQPYWGKNRLLVASNVQYSDSIQMLPFSTDSNSAFYKEALKIVELYKGLSQEQIDIAKFWNDAPGVSGTPSGHLISLCRVIGIKEKLSLARMLELYVLTGIALNDAVIESFRLKYTFNLIRPITFIHRNITYNFSTAINTPPFPEFPSGHSYQSGACSEVLIHIFGDSYAFMDSTNVNRQDINGTVRDYKNFTEMAEEISISRFYGGIHYVYTLDESLKFGRKIGRNTIQSVRFRK